MMMMMMMMMKANEWLSAGLHVSMKAGLPVTNEGIIL